MHLYAYFSVFNLLLLLLLSDYSNHNPNVNFLNSCSKAVH